MTTVNGSLDKIFNAQGVALIGASSKPGRLGHGILQYALEMDFNGSLYPINPSANSILGLQCYKNIRDIPGRVDLVVLAIPAAACMDAAREIAERKAEKGDVYGVVVLSGGFSEHSTEGEKREKALLDILIPKGIRIVGPNCQGIVDTYSGINTTFDVNRYPKGELSFIAQSSAFSASYLRWAQPLGLVGLNKFVSMGNMADVNATELLSYLKNDERTKCIAMYLEGIANPRELLRTMAEVSRHKPIVVLKAGKTDLGSKAAQTHTGSIAGRDDFYNGAFSQAGAIRATTVPEFYDTSRAFAKLSLPKGNRICILSVVGGPGTICMDELSSSKEIQMAPLAEATKSRLRDILAPTAIIGRPEGYIDMTGSISEQMHQDIMKIILSDHNVDGVIYLTTPPGFSDDKELANNMVEAYQSLPQEDRKPFLSVLCFGYTVAEGRKIMEANGLPTFEYPDVAAKVMTNMVRYSTYRARQHH